MRIKPEAVQIMLENLADALNSRHLSPRSNATVTLAAGDWFLICEILRQHRDEAPKDMTVCPGCQSTNIENRYDQEVTSNVSLISRGDCNDCGREWTNALHIVNIDLFE